MRRDALSGLLSGGFLLAVIAAVLLIVVAVPEYAEPARGSSDAPPALALTGASPSPSSAPQVALPSPTTPLPDRLKGYRWPVSGGWVTHYYARDRDGRFVIDGERIHGGLAISWFEGALVKAAHAGRVVAAGRDWHEHVGYDGDLDDYYARLKRKKARPSLGVVIDDGNGYRSVYSELKDLRVKPGERVKAGAVIGAMGYADEPYGQYMVNYELVRTDGDWLKVSNQARRLGLPDYVREHVDPLAVLRLEARKKPDTDKRRPPTDPPRLSEYGAARGGARAAGQS